MVESPGECPDHDQQHLYGGVGAGMDLEGRSIHPCDPFEALARKPLLIFLGLALGAFHRTFKGITAHHLVPSLRS